MRPIDEADWLAERFKESRARLRAVASSAVLPAQRKGTRL
jgi:hypothetical protein